MNNSNSKTYVNKAISLIQFQKSDINLFIKEKQIIISNIKLSPKFKSNNDLKLKSLSQLKTFIKTDDSYQKEQHLFISEYPSHYPFFLFDNSQIIAAAYFIDTVKIYHGKYIRSCIFYKFGKYDLLQKKNVNAHRFCISLKISYTIDFVNRTLSVIESNSIKKNTNHFLIDKKKKQTKQKATKQMNSKAKSFNKKTNKEKIISKKIFKTQNKKNLEKEQRIAAKKDLEFKKLQKDFLIVDKINEKTLNNEKPLDNKYQSRIIHRNYSNIMNLENENILYNLQIIHGSNNHVTNKHQIEDKIIRIAYSKTNKINLIEMVLHYCVKCNVYFDFYESFKQQLKSLNIKMTDIIANYTDENGHAINFEKLTLKEHSKLAQYGYSVKMQSMKVSERQALLKLIMDKNLLTPSVIKNHLEYLIRYNGAKKHMEHAVEQWEKDISFINLCIKDRQ